MMKMRSNERSKKNNKSLPVFGQDPISWTLEKVQSPRLQAGAGI